MLLVLLCLMKKRNGWSALNSMEGRLIRTLTSLAVPDADSVPCSFISTKDLWKTLDKNRFPSVDIPEKSALLWLKASLIPILLRVDWRSYISSSLNLGRCSCTSHNSIMSALVHSLNFSQVMAFSSYSLEPRKKESVISKWSENCSLSETFRYYVNELQSLLLPKVTKHTHLEILCL